jgi:hypothetical protein
MKFQSRSTKFDAFFLCMFWCFKARRNSDADIDCRSFYYFFIEISLSQAHFLHFIFLTPTEWHVSTCHKSHTTADKHNFDASLFSVVKFFSSKASFFCDSWMMAWLYMLLSHSPCRYILFFLAQVNTQNFFLHTHQHRRWVVLICWKIFANLFFDVFTGALKKKDFWCLFQSRGYTWKVAREKL